ncbi:hypothetical protein DEV91_11953 [Phyllobacterium brassicacearum]|nr:hypothetical protein DEV91_11953 [Phyllobacterium brassicacearum]
MPTAARSTIRICTAVCVLDFSVVDEQIDVMPFMN